jgi:cytochrome P450
MTAVLPDIDPFSPLFLADPYPAHEMLREAGPVVWLDRYDIWASARHVPVRAALHDPDAFCSSAGVGSVVAAIRPTGEPRRMLNNTLRGLETLPLRLVPA